MNKTLKKILPMLAIVVGIGGAYATANVQDPCTASGHIGYSEPIDQNYPPDADENMGIENYGQFGTNFTCTPSVNSCHWTYVSSTGQWIQCAGNRIDL